MRALVELCIRYFNAIYDVDSYDIMWYATFVCEVCGKFAKCAVYFYSMSLRLPTC